MTPLCDVYSHLVYAAGRADVSTVSIHGRVVMRNRQLLSIDEDRAIEDVRELASKSWSASLRTKRDRPLRQPADSSHRRSATSIRLPSGSAQWNTRSLHDISVIGRSTLPFDR